MTMMTMRYLREPRGMRKQWVYQRSIPSKLQAYDRGRNGKSRKQIEIGLGRSRAEAIANYKSVHEQQEERFSRLKQYFLNGTQPSYRIEQLQSFCREWHIEDQSDPKYEFNWEIMWGSEYAPFLDGQKLHDLEQEEEVGGIVDYIDALEIPQWKKEVYRDLKSMRSKADLTSIKDIFSFYKEHKPTIRTKAAQKREDNELARLQKDLLDSIGNVAALVLSKEHAIKLKEYLLTRKNRDGESLSSETVRKYFKRYRGIYQYWLVQNELHLKKVNPFSAPELPKSKKAGRDEKRLPLTDEILSACNREYLLREPSNPTMLLWFLLQLTGCRVAEISWLLIDEVSLDSYPPYLDIKERETGEGLERSVKTAVSVRKVPLTPLAANFAASAVAASTSNYLFPKWESSHDSAPSAVLGKVLHKHRPNKKYTNHSLRHNQRDRLEDVDASDRLRDAIMGWENKSGMASRYGKAKLEDMYKVMCDANEQLEEEIKRAMRELQPEWAEKLGFPAHG